jgi:hypothetical protein
MNVGTEKFPKKGNFVFLGDFLKRMACANRFVGVCFVHWTGWGYRLQKRAFYKPGRCRPLEKSEGNSKVRFKPGKDIES